MRDNSVTIAKAIAIILVVMAGGFYISVLVWVFLFLEPMVITD